jgi:prepilin-type N-terminal cleavage/methylation domain-containing protein
MSQGDLRVFRAAGASVEAPAAGTGFAFCVHPVTRACDPVPPHRCAARPARGAGGFTLLELLVVLAILAAVAGLAISLVGGTAETASRQVTEVSLAEIREAILGREGVPGYAGDLRRLPATLTEVFVQGAQPPFDPVTALGWRGPYVRTSGATYALLPLQGFTTVYGAAGDPAVLDAWGRPVVIQVPDADGDGVPTEADRRHARLLSAGPDGTIQTPRTDAAAVPPGTAAFPLRSQCADDVVLYLAVADGRP